MRYILFSLLTGIFIIALFSCQPKAVKKEMIAAKPPRIFTLPDSLKMVKSENVRESPNGAAFGKLHKNETIYLMGRVGNWLLFHNQRFDSVYVWAPSAGLPYLNLFSPATYFDTTTRQFYPTSYFPKLFGSNGQRLKNESGVTYLFFSNLGLGSHQETVLNVVEESKQIIHHGISLFLDKTGSHITGVKVDFRRPVEGVRLVLRKCNLPFKPASYEDEAHLVWNKGVLFAGLVVELERKEWKSHRFSSIIFHK